MAKEIDKDLVTAIKLAFPDFKSPKDIPSDKWQQICLAYIVWKFIFYEKGVAFTLTDTLLPVEKAQSYLNEIVEMIMKE